MSWFSKNPNKERPTKHIAVPANQTQLIYFHRSSSLNKSFENGIRNVKKESRKKILSGEPLKANSMFSEPFFLFLC